MNKEMWYRWKRAGEYQKKAIRALFPDNVNEHLDVIEREMKTMVMEMTADRMKEWKKKASGKEEREAGVKKVDIS